MFCRRHNWEVIGHGYFKNGNSFDITFKGTPKSKGDRTLNINTWRLQGWFICKHIENVLAEPLIVYAGGSLITIIKSYRKEYETKPSL